MYEEHIRAAARSMAENMQRSPVPMYGKGLRLPDKGAVIGLLKEIRRLVFPAYYGDPELMAAMAALHVAALRICSGGVTLSSSCVSSCRSVYSSSTTRMSMAIYASSCFFRGHVRTIRVPLPNALCMSTSASGPKNSFSRSVTFCTPEPPA